MAALDKFTHRIGRSEKRFGRKKGQFFLLGAFLIAVLFFVALPRPASISFEGTDDMRHFALNLQKEMPNAFNLGIRQGDYLSVMNNFTWFAARVLNDRDISFTTMMGFGNNISTTDFNVKVWKYYGSNLTVNITIGSSLFQLFVAYNQSNSTTFTSVGDTFNISFKYAREERNMTWARDKYSVYGLLKFVRTNNTVISSFEG